MKITAHPHIQIGADRLANLDMTSNGGCIACGSAMSVDGNVTGHIVATTSGDFWIVKLDANGKKNRFIRIF